MNEIETEKRSREYLDRFAKKAIKFQWNVNVLFNDGWLD
jgi:hypothetical protein